MGNDGVQGERRGVVEDAVGHGIDRRFARADTAARGETVPQRLRERKADAVGPVHVLIGVQRARRRIAQPAGAGTPPRRRRSGPTPPWPCGAHDGRRQGSPA